MMGPSVIVIGAGAAGIAAAAKLFENSIENVIVLEAEDRIGGRIHSIKFGEGFVDLGAEYCHGEKNNIVYELAKNYDILEPGVEAFNEKVYYSDGTEMFGGFIQDLEALVLDYENFDNEDSAKKSLGNVFTDKYCATLAKNYHHLKIFKEGLRFAEGQVSMVEGCYSWFDSSAKTDYVVCEGDQTLVLNKVGYKTIIELLMKRYTNSIEEKIRLGSKVKKISLNDNNTVTVVTSNNVVYLADYVIFTPSIGVLKQQRDDMFDPPLPVSKQEAITNIGFGGVLKIAFYFSQKWWNCDDRAFSFFWSEEDFKNIDMPWLTCFKDFSRVLHNPNVWLGWFSGNHVPEIEKLPYETLRNGCQNVLEKFLGKVYNVTAIDKLVPTKWCSNENFLGVYSYVKTGTYKEDVSYQEILAEPLKNSSGKPVIFFAGEATHKNYYATVHGAIESGYREAGQIISLNKQL